MLTKIDINFIEHEYNFKKLKLSSRASGFTAINFFAKADGRDLFIKQYSKNDFTKVSNGLKISQFIYKHHICSPIALINKNGQQFLKIKDKTLVIYPKINGCVLHGLRLNEYALIEISKYIAMLHNLSTSNLEITANKEIPIINFNSTELNSEISDIIKETIAIKLFTLKQIEFNYNFDDLLQDKCLIHGDFHNENILFNKEGKLVALLDFDEARFGSRLEDIISFIMLGLFNDGFNESNIARAKLFCQNYNQHALKPINSTMMKQGLLYYLYKLCQSSFLEHKLAALPSDDLILMIKRDIYKIKYLQDNIPNLIYNICKQ